MGKRSDLKRHQKRFESHLRCPANLDTEVDDRVLIGSREATLGHRARDLGDSVRSAVDGRGSWLLVGSTVTFVYLAWTLLTLMHGSAQDFIHVGRSFVEGSQASPVISGFHGYRYDGDIGYDGQFNYFMALDPVRAASYTDYPAYRYTRIVYPAVAGLLGGHNPDLVANTLIAINLAMIALGVAVLGAWLRRRGRSAWLAAVYGFYPGIYVALQRDTSEIMAFSLVIVAIYLYDVAPRLRFVLPAAFFALAGLTRETTLVFAYLWGLDLLLSGNGRLRHRVATNWRGFLIFLAISFGPLLAWKIFLLVWLGSLGLEGVLTPIPFSGIHYLIRHEVEMEQLRTVVVPAFLCLVAGAIAIYAGSRKVETWALLTNALLYTAFLSSPSFEDFTSSARVMVPIALALVLAVPYLPQRAKTLFWVSAALWLTPMIFWIILPVEGGLQELIVHRL